MSLFDWIMIIFKYRDLLPRSPILLLRLFAKTYILHDKLLLDDFNQVSILPFKIKFIINFVRFI
ncbi:MAG: hypothetical protein QG646_2256 [Euryarchaeota archaeon]|nr:hypothetical protein [Euryarchaeota archaeon]